MKRIFKGPLWFTIIAIVVFALFVANGCKNTEIQLNTDKQPNEEIHLTYHTLSFVAAEVDIEPQSVKHGSHATAPDNPERDEYLFDGWFSGTGLFVNEWDFNSDIVTQDTTLYAKWESNYTYYTLNFAGAGVKTKSQSIKSGENATAPDNPERVSFIFGGWFTDDDTFLNAWDFNSDIVTQDTTLYAKWDAISIEGITWKLVGLVDAQSGNLTELEPKDCERCYTLIFYSDSTFLGHTVSNSIDGLGAGRCKIDYETSVIHILYCILSEAAERYDGEKYIHLLLEKISITSPEHFKSFTVSNTHPRILRLYSIDKSNYLEYKEIEE